MTVTKYLYFNIRFGLQETLLCLFLQKTKTKLCSQFSILCTPVRRGG